MYSYALDQEGRWTAADESSLYRPVYLVERTLTMKAISKRWLLITASLAALASVLFAFGLGAQAREHHPSHPSQRTDAAIDFRNDMRKLWEDHVTWTRLAIVSLVAGLPDTTATVDRLLQNQADLGDAIQPYYGDAAGAQLTGLLRDHILIAAEIIGAAGAGDSAAVAEASARWYANADEIAAFLSSANPASWPEDEMTAMMREHLDLTLREAVARLQGDFDADVALYDAIHLQILHMADMLSLGIIDQFPGRFR